MEALIDGRLTEMRSGIEYREGVPVSSHANSLRRFLHVTKKNFRVIASGHVYVLNYDEATYEKKMPETFDEYLKMKAENKPLW